MISANLLLMEANSSRCASVSASFSQAAILFSRPSAAANAHPRFSSSNLISVSILVLDRRDRATMSRMPMKASKADPAQLLATSCREQTPMGEESGIAEANRKYRA
jgi:hypothetical protein